MSRLSLIYSTVPALLATDFRGVMQSIWEVMSSGPAVAVYLIALVAIIVMVILALMNRDSGVSEVVIASDSATLSLAGQKGVAPTALAATEGAAEGALEEQPEG